MINSVGWKTFPLTKLFKVEYGNKFDLCQMVEAPNSKIAFVSRTATNNGVSAYVEEVDGVTPYSAGALTVALGGSLGSSFLQPLPFYTGQNVAVLIPKTAMSDQVKLFIAALIKKESDIRFVAFGRELNKHIKADFTIRLPAKTPDEPNFDEIEKIMDSVKFSVPVSSNPPITSSLSKEGWREFELEKLFVIKKGKRLTKMDQTDGDTPYIGAIDSNNGVSAYIGQAAIHEGNTISLSYNGSVGEAFYQPKPFWATDDVNVLYCKNKKRFNRYVALFICAVLRQEKYRFSYGRKWVLENMLHTKIPLPAIGDEPDWGLMEEIVKGLPYGDII